MIRLACLLALALALSGCDVFLAPFMSRADKINQAYPVPDKLSAALAQLFVALDSDPHSKEVRAQHAQLLQARAAECGASVELGRLDTPAKVKTKIGETTCFTDFDVKFVDWVELSRVAVELRKPPLVPLTALPARAALGPRSERPLFAKDAAVAILPERGQMSAVELPSMRVIKTFPALHSPDGAGTLSPNGRVVAIPVHPGLVMLEVTTGKTLWSTTKYNQVVAWLPDTAAALLIPKNGYAAALLDHQTATVVPYPLPVSQVSWAIPVAGSAGRLVMGGAGNVAVVDHARRSDGGIDIATVKQFRLSPTSEIRSAAIGWRYAPFLMSKGRKLVYLSQQDWAWLDIESGEAGKWDAAALGTVGFAQLSDTTIFLDLRGGMPISAGQVFNIEQGTLTSVLYPARETGVLYPAAPRQGFVAREKEGLVVGGAVAVEGQPQPIEKAAADIALWLEQLKLQNAARLEQEQANRSAKADAQRASAARTPIPGVPTNAHVSAIGVYEAATPGQGRRPGTVDVKLVPSKMPLVLVLSSYGPVQWNIQANGRPIAAILLSSMHRSTVQGYDGNVVVIGSQHAHEMGSEEHALLKALVAQYLPMPIRLFQGTYRGSEFSVPAN